MSARRPPKPINKTRRRVALGIGVGVMVIFLIGVAWVSLGHSTDPDYQQRISMRDMSGTQDYLVNLWIDPKPPTVGQATITVQVASSVGTGVPLDGVTLKLTRPDGSDGGTVTGQARPQDSKPQYGFEAKTDFNVPGTWHIQATTAAGDNVRDSTFTVEVVKE